jgi:hypothetical protein
MSSQERMEEGQKKEEEVLPQEGQRQAKEERHISPQAQMRRVPIIFLFQ